MEDPRLSRLRTPQSAAKAPLTFRTLRGVVIIFLASLCACGSSASSDAARSEPRGAESNVPAPEVSGPISGGIRGRPWAGTVERLAPLEPYHYVQEEFFFSGNAQGRDPSGVPITDEASDFTSRLLVIRPTDPSAFNGTVIVEWFNETGQVDLPVLWGLAHDELMREGYAWVGVSAQQEGVSGSPLAMKFWDPVRYAALNVPSNDYMYDIYAQGARALLGAGKGPAPLGPLHVKRLMAVGESQSGSWLREYANNIQPEQHLFDGFLIHTSTGEIQESIDVPVLMLLTESEIDGITSPSGGSQLGGADALLDRLVKLVLGLAANIAPPDAPSPDHQNLRVWEIAGGSHFDQQGLYYMTGLATEYYTAPLAISLPINVPLVCARPPDQLNIGRPTIAALHQLNSWMSTGKAPRDQPRLTLNEDGSIARDKDGFAMGGIRMPNYAVPAGLNRGDSCIFFGTYDAFSASEMRARYPTQADFRTRLADAASQAITAGTLLQSEADAYINEAQAVNVWH